MVTSTCTDEGMQGAAVVMTSDFAWHCKRFIASKQDGVPVVSHSTLNVLFLCSALRTRFHLVIP